MQLRATNPADKELRRETLLDAAEQLWLAQPDSTPSVAAIASEARLAKGTVYLYFRSKEALLLAVHERHVANFFSRVSGRAGEPEPMLLENMFGLIRQFLTNTPAFLPLAAQCHGMLERNIPLEVGYAFEERTYARLDTVVADLQRHFPRLTAALMLQSYALMLGLWQLMRPTPLKQLMKERELSCACNDDYLFMLESALNALWRGALLPKET